MKNKTFMDWAGELIEFFGENGMLVVPPPRIRLDNSKGDQFDPFAPTGHFSFDEDEIVLHTGSRHCKDILRTLAHELVHVDQYRSDPKAYEEFDKSGSLEENPELEEYERDAYARGNILFRKWTETHGLRK